MPHALEGNMLKITYTMIIVVTIISFVIFNIATMEEWSKEKKGMYAFGSVSFITVMSLIALDKFLDKQKEMRNVQAY